MPTKQVTYPATWKRTRGGIWCVMGTTEVVKVGTVPVKKRNGEVEDIEIKSLGKVFQKDGVDHVYGYKDERDN